MRSQPQTKTAAPRQAAAIVGKAARLASAVRARRWRQRAAVAIYLRAACARNYWAAGLFFCKQSLNRRRRLVPGLQPAQHSPNFTSWHRPGTCPIHAPPTVAARAESNARPTCSTLRSHHETSSYPLRRCWRNRVPVAVGRPDRLAHRQRTGSSHRANGSTDSHNSSHDNRDAGLKGCRRAPWSHGHGQAQPCPDAGAHRHPPGRTERQAEDHRCARARLEHLHRRDDAASRHDSKSSGLARPA